MDIKKVKWAVASKEYRARMKEANRCTSCGELNNSGFSRCDSCREKSTNRSRLYYINNRDKCLDYNKKYYKRNPHKKIEDSRIAKLRCRDEWYEYFNSIDKNKCEICGYNKCWSALEFHHVDPLLKEEAISVLVQKKFTKERKIEVDKCIVLCANCHRELHYNERVNNGSRLVRGMQ